MHMAMAYQLTGNIKKVQEEGHGVGETCRANSANN
jgi:hypothetical protein